MAKLTAWLVTLLGVLLILNAIPGIANALVMGKWLNWVIALGVLAIGIGKLVRNYSK
jgi:hypothetical protein